ncbi:MAG: arsenate reductase ArsC [Halioglobus sp.]
MTDRVYNVLFLCTGNSARSILAEVLVNRLGNGRFRGYSAGSQPKGEVHPLALEELERHGYPTAGLRSKRWDEFAAPDAPEMDFVFTVCGNAGAEVCPVWPGRPTTAHWGIADPAAVGGDAMARKAAFDTAFRELRDRIALFVKLPLASLDPAQLQARLAEIGRCPTAEPGPEET